MAMLAEPRRKQKVINLRAKNSAWSKDANKFGQRMLEKMGWSAGKGLGAKENGIVEHVVARYKNDDKGLGFEDRNDQWTKHEDDFNALLANLSNGNEDTEAQTHSGISLEVKSKKSKARVHFHKFTRAKDLSRYSQKDLANIFGKKTLKSEDKKSEILKDIKTTEQVFTEKGSMEDYFKNKLKSLNSKNKMPVPLKESQYEGEADCGFQGFSGATNDILESINTSPGFGFSFYSSNVQNTMNTEQTVNNEENDVQVASEGLENTKKSKNKKKSKRKNKPIEDLQIPSTLPEEKVLSNGESDGCIPYADLEGETKKRKKSKKKKDSAEQDLEGETKKLKKSKKKKGSAEHVVKENKSPEEEIYVPKKKKKKKNKNLD